MSIILRQSRMIARFRVLANAFFHASILDHAAHHAGPGHQNIVPLLLAQTECCFCGSLGVIQIPAVQVEVRVIHVYATESMVVLVLLIDGRGFREFGQRLLSQLLKTVAIWRLDFALSRSSTRGSFSSARCLRINLS